MPLPDNAQRLRIYIGSAHQVDGKPTYEVIVEEARKRGMAGATVTRGICGFGARSLVHTSKILRLSEDLPLLVELVDSAENINAFRPFLEDVLQGGMVTIEPITVLFYKGKETK